MSNPLRNKNIDYERGWFSVTFQVAFNKSALGAIIGEKCALNELGRMVHETWLSHPAHTPGLQLDEFVVMPNHFHAIVHLGPNLVPLVPNLVPLGPNLVPLGPNLEPLGPNLEPLSPNLVPLGHRAEGGAGLRDNLVALGHRAQGAEGGLSSVIGKFKSYTNHLYLKLKEAGKCVDIGPRLWHSSFYDNLISSPEELQTIRRYIRDNPKNWNQDRFGAVTTYSIGNAELLSERLIAFVASESISYPRPTAGGVGAGLREWKGHKIANLVAPPPNLVALGHRAQGGRGEAEETAKNRSRPIISTFTSPQEREIRAKCLRSHRPFIWVCPGGIWDPLPPAIARACADGWGFVCSPVPSRTGVNKQRANWCNQYIIKQAESVWVGSIRPGGSLETLLNEIKGKEEKR